MVATPQRVLTSRLNTLAESVENGEIDTDDVEAIRSFIDTDNPNSLMDGRVDGVRY